jgi:hypothetical protein
MMVYLGIDQHARQITVTASAGRHADDSARTAEGALIKDFEFTLPSSCVIPRRTGSQL